MEANKFTIPSSLSRNALVALLLSFVFFMSDLQTIVASTTALKKSPNYAYKTFIKNQCNSTTFPKDCYKTLSSYASTIKTNPLTLCNTSLVITLKTARKYYVLTSSLTKGKRPLSRTEKAIVKDCVSEIGDCIEELSKSLNAMKNLTGSKEEVLFQMANIQTWVSASITDEDTCTDGFDGVDVSSYLKKPITKYITSLTRLTSNTLALINSLNKYY